MIAQKNHGMFNQIVVNCYRLRDFYSILFEYINNLFYTILNIHI